MFKILSSITVFVMLSITLFAQQSEVLKEKGPNNSLVELNVSNNSYMMLSSQNLDKAKLKASTSIVKKEKSFQINGKYTSRIETYHSQILKD
ncbi:MAG: hypothetical protein ROO71_01815 [Balneola sp.]